MQLNSYRMVVLVCLGAYQFLETSLFFKITFYIVPIKLECLRVLHFVYSYIKLKFCLVTNFVKCFENHEWTLAWKIPWVEEPGRLQSMGLLRVGHDLTFTFHFHALEKEMATHSSVLAWSIPGTGEPGGLPSMGSHRVRHD